jgi:Na+-driven multidrug efflux pump
MCADTKGCRRKTDGITCHGGGQIALTMVISNAPAALFGAVDAAVIGPLAGPALVGAVGLGAFTLSTCYWVFGFLQMSTSGLAT